MYYCYLEHQTLLSPPDTSTTELHSCFGPASSFLLELFVIALCPSPVTYWTFGPGELIFQCPIFSYCPWESPDKNIGVVCHFLLQWTMFCQNFSLWPIRLRWPYISWLIASLSYISSFATTRLWSMKCQVLVDYIFTGYFLSVSRLSSFSWLLSLPCLPSVVCLSQGKEIPFSCSRLNPV